MRNEWKFCPRSYYVFPTLFETGFFPCFTNATHQLPVHYSIIAGIQFRSNFHNNLVTVFKYRETLAFGPVNNVTVLRKYHVRDQYMIAINQFHLSYYPKYAANAYTFLHAVPVSPVEPHTVRCAKRRKKASFRPPALLALHSEACKRRIFPGRRKYFGRDGRSDPAGRRNLFTRKAVPDEVMAAAAAGFRFSERRKCCRKDKSLRSRR